MARKQLQGCYVHSGRGDKEEEVFCSRHSRRCKQSISFICHSFLTTSVNLSLQNTVFTTDLLVCAGCTAGSVSCNLHDLLSDVKLCGLLCLRLC